MSGTPGDRTIDPRSRSWSRRIGYRVLPGDGYSYVLHMRPREWPIVAAHLLSGFLISIPAGQGALPRWPDALLGTAVFVLLLNGGTLAINSAFDRDEGDVGYLDAPPPPPRHLFGFGMGSMALGQIVAILALPTAFSIVYGVCFVLSIVYSVPPFRWKAVAGLDLVINAAGFGALTGLAGWTLSGLPVPRWGMLLLLAYAPLFAALYPLTQFYQIEEDRERGDRTMAIAVGIRASLLFALAMTIVAFALLVAGLVDGPGARLWFLALIPLAAWATLLLRWLRRHPSMSPAEHKRGMYAALRAWALTNITVIAAVLAPLLA